MARRPFQISACGVKPRFQELSSSEPTGSTRLVSECPEGSAMAVEMPLNVDTLRSKFQNGGGVLYKASA